MTLNFLLKIHLFTSFYMTGIIWLVQVIHYPLFNLVSSNNWQDYHAKHIRGTSLVIAAPMFTELLSLCAIFYLAPAYRGHYLMLSSFFLLLIIWLTTFLISVPIHNQLALEFNQGSCKKLTQTNWIRTISWSLKSLILLYWLSLNY